MLVIDFPVLQCRLFLVPFLNMLFMDFFEERERVEGAQVGWRRLKGTQLFWKMSCVPFSFLRFRVARIQRLPTAIRYCALRIPAREWSANLLDESRTQRPKPKARNRAAVSRLEESVVGFGSGRKSVCNSRVKRLSSIVRPAALNSIVTGAVPFSLSSPFYSILTLIFRPVVVQGNWRS